MFGRGNKGDNKTATRRAVGDDLIKVLPDDNRPWIFKWHLVRLNLIILGPLLSQAAGGYDGKFFLRLIYARTMALTNMQVL